MPDDLQALSQSIRSLAERLEVVESRLAHLETGEPSDRTAPVPVLPEDGPGIHRAPLVPDGLLPLFGRTLIVLGGGFLLRAFTESGAVPGLGGAAAGLAYAAWWLGQAEAAARAGRRTSATLHGLASQALALPLLIEAVLRFRLLGAVGAGVVLLVGSAATLAVAIPRRLTLVAWSGVTLSTGAALVLLVGTRDLVPLTAALLALGLLVEATAGPGRLGGLRWIVAGGADLSVAILGIIASRAEGLPEGYAPLRIGVVTVTVLALPVLYVGSAALRTLLGKEPSGRFDLAQSVVALILGFGAASQVLAAAGASTAPLGWAAVILGAACYFAAFEVIDRRSGGSGAFYAATTLAGLLVLTGGAAAGLGTGFAIACSFLGLGGIATGSRFDRQTLRIHGVLYLIAAGGAAGLVRAAHDGLRASPAAAWASPGAWSVVTLTSIVVGYVGLAWERRTKQEASRLRTAPRLLLGATLGVMVAGLGAGILARGLATLVEPTALWAWVAALRTAVLSLLAVALAGIAWKAWLPELRALVYPVLGATAIKVLLEDFPHGEPLTLFLGLAALGGALVAVPRLMSRQP